MLETDKKELEVNTFIIFIIKIIIIGNFMNPYFLPSADRKLIYDKSFNVIKEKLLIEKLVTNNI